MIKRVSFFCSCVMLTVIASSQILTPVKWTFSNTKTGVNEYELSFSAHIEKGWHMYSQHLPSEDGPIATSFRIKKEPSFKLIGGVSEPKPHVEYDPNFDMELSFFGGKTVFKQKIILTSNSIVTGEIEYMVCDESRCLPPEIETFSFDLKFEDSSAGSIPKKEEKTTNPVVNSKSQKPINQILNPVKWEFYSKKLQGNDYELIFKSLIDESWHIYSQKLPSDDIPSATKFVFSDNSSIELLGNIEEEGNLKTELDKGFGMILNYYENEVIFKRIVRVYEKTTLKGTIEFTACDNEKCLSAEIIPFEFEFNDINPIEVTDINSQQTNPYKKNDSTSSFWGIFIAGFLGGLLALLTPCVFPMIPMTVSFFTKQSKTKNQGIANALLYGASIIVIYVLMGFGITALFGADALNALSTNVWFNLAFFVLLVVFAISFLGAFEITLPSSWINKADSAADKGGFIGIFFMAFTLSLVSFSCTGPIIGTLLVEAAVNGGVAGPITGMLGFSFALALPFGLFAAFPGWLNSLPQSGGWLNSVKVSLGFLELALALKFLSNADLVVQAGFLKRELFISIWIGIFLLLTCYLLGLFKLSHDSDLKHVSVPRLLFAILSFVFTIYLIPGLWGAPLKLISGFPPPMFYSESPNGVGGAVSKAVSATSHDFIPKGADPEHCPHNLNCFHDYEEGLAYAKKVNKPVLLDFTGWACVNCRKMEEQVWSDPRVLERLNNDVVLISLYVDEKINLPEEEQFEVEIRGKKKQIKTVGNKWSYLQASRYGTNSQPYYVMIDLNEKQLQESSAYDSDIEKYIDWLDRGQSIFKKNN